MAEYLDLVMPIVEKNDRGEYVATPYLEDILHGVVFSVGGEGSVITNELISGGLQGDRVPYLFGVIASLQKKVSHLEHSLSTHIVEAAVKQLQVDTRPFKSMVKAVNYTAKNRDYIEAQKNVTIKLPANAARDDEVIVANGDGSRIRADGNGNKIKYTALANIFNIYRPGSSKHFQFFVDNVADVSYWRAR